VRHRAVVLAQLPAGRDRGRVGSVALGGERLGERLRPLDRVVAGLQQRRLAALLDAGESDAAIRAFYVGRYGEWILLRPPASGVGALVWLLPVTGLILGAAGLAFAFRRWRREPALAATDEDRALVEAALAAGADPTGAE